MRKVLICDDEPLARQRMSKLVGELEGYQPAGEAAEGVTLINEVGRLNPDVVLVDIQMPGMDGLEAARHIAGMDCPPALIFCTAHDSYALQAFQAQAVDYLLKPIRREALEQALAKAQRLNRAQLGHLGEELAQAPDEPASSARGHISAYTHRGIELVPVDDIRYFRADHKYVRVRHSAGEVLVDETLKDLEAEFPEGFLRIHRNALINKRYLEGLENLGKGRYRARLQDVDEPLEVSRRQASQLRRLLKPQNH